MMSSVDDLGESPRPAATLILVRASSGLPEVLLMKRSSSARFMPNAYVFAGGAVDADDVSADAYDLSEKIDDRGASDLLEVPEHGLSFFVAAVREGFEECGLLLAYDTSGVLVNFSGWSEAALKHLRTQLGSGELGLARICRNHGWRLALDQLWYFDHWITPIALKRRFDTRFFIALAPLHQTASLASMEMSELIWRTPLAALQEYAKGELLLMQATRSTLAQLAEFPDLDTLFEHVRRPRKITATLPVMGTGAPP